MTTNLRHAKEVYMYSPSTVHAHIAVVFALSRCRLQCRRCGRSNRRRCGCIQRRCCCKSIVGIVGGEGIGSTATSTSTANITSVRIARSVYAVAAALRTLAAAVAATANMFAAGIVRSTAGAAAAAVAHADAVAADAAQSGVLQRR